MSIGRNHRTEKSVYYFEEAGFALDPTIPYAWQEPRVSKNAVFELNFLPGFWTRQISYIMPILTGFGPNSRGPKSGQGKLADLDALSLRPPRHSGWTTSACRSAPMPLHRFLGWPSTTAGARPKMRLASPFVCLPYAVCPLGRKPSRCLTSAWRGNKRLQVRSSP